MLCFSGLCPIREVESRARQAEEKFEDVNEKLHYTLIRNKELERELETILMRSGEKEFQGREEENGEREDGEDEEEDEDDDDDEIRPVDHSPKSLKKGEAYFLVLLYSGYIYERKHVWVTNILKEY